MNTTWVLVADSSRARIFRAETPIGGIVEIETLTHPESRLHEQEITSDLPGRSFDSHGQGRHAMGAKVAPKQHEQQAFAKQICERLDNGRGQGEFQQLILVATPSLLGLLRKNLSEETAKQVTYELDKNISRLQADEIRRHLPERLPRLPL